MLSHFQMVVKDDWLPLVYCTCTRNVQLWPGKVVIHGRCSNLSWPIRVSRACVDQSSHVQQVSQIINLRKADVKVVYRIRTPELLKDMIFVAPRLHGDSSLRLSFAQGRLVVFPAESEHHASSAKIDCDRGGVAWPDTIHAPL